MSSESLLPPEITVEQSFALQTYKFFNGGSSRKDNVSRFVSGESVQLELDYPILEDSKDIDRHVSNLRQCITWKEETSATPEYRLAEAYFLQASRRINGDIRSVKQPEVDAFQELNESLYGAPDEAVVAQMLDRVWSCIDAKRGSVANPLIDELKNGFTFIANTGESVDVPPLPMPRLENNLEPLPVLSEEAYDWLSDKLKEEFQPVNTLFQSYYDAHINEREDKRIQPEDSAILFEMAVGLQKLTDVRIMRDELATSLSWSSADNAVIVGMQRDPIDTTEELLGAYVHEVGVHGKRHMNGKKIGDESLASGLYTEADADENPDYLTFEEGLTSTLQQVAQGKKEDWDIDITGHDSMGHYLNIFFAYAGWSPRQIQEVMSRVRIINSTKISDEQIKEDVVKKARLGTASQVVRAFRSTPSDKILRTSDGITLHYSKDLTYAAGKIKAIKLINELVKLPEPQRSEKWSMLFEGKYDPTNHRQQELVESYLTRDRIKV